ncbi:MAG: hypothetical protein HY719_15275, partial [Planctomycetes bacterium]|nr:hypothetical protein [Planctomycetota bacterium]
MRKKLIVFVVLLAGFAAGGYSLYGDDFAKEMIQRYGGQALGVEVRVESARLSLASFSLEVRNIRVADPVDPKKDFFTAGENRASVDLGALLEGRFVLNSFVVKNAALRLVRGPDGRLNVEHFAPGGEPAADQDKAAEGQPAAGEGGESVLVKTAMEQDWVTRFRELLEQYQERQQDQAE